MHVFRTAPNLDLKNPKHLATLMPLYCKAAARVWCSDGGFLRNFIWRLPLSLQYFYI